MRAIGFDIFFVSSFDAFRWRLGEKNERDSHYVNRMQIR